MSVDHLFDTLLRGGEVHLDLPNGQRMVLHATDLIRTEEAVLLFAAIESVMLKITDVGCEPVNAKLCKELEIECPATPPLSALIRGAEEKLGRNLTARIRRLKARRDGLLHGTDPIFSKNYVRQVREAHAEVMALASDAIGSRLGGEIARCQTARGTIEGWRNPGNTALLKSLLRLVGIEAILREYLESVGLATRGLKAINCLHKLLEDVSEQKVRWPRGMAWNLRKVLVLRNALAHGHIFMLTDAHLAVVQRAEQDLDQVLGSVAVRKAGGSVSLGDLGTSALAMGIVTITTAGGRFPS